MTRKQLREEFNEFMSSARMRTGQGLNFRTDHEINFFFDTKIQEIMKELLGKAKNEKCFYCGNIGQCDDADCQRDYGYNQKHQDILNKIKEMGYENIQDKTT